MTADILIKDIKYKIKEIASEIFSGTQVLFAYLYGSYAVDLDHPFSDLDIGIYVEEAMSDKYLELELSLSLIIDKKLWNIVESEVRIINLLPLIIKGKIITEGILIYSRDEIRRIEFEIQTLKAYFDFLPIINEYHRIYMEKEKADLI